MWEAKTESLNMALGDTFKVIVPGTLLGVLRSIHRKLPHVEFGLYAKATIDYSTKTAIVSDEFYIPKQNVTSVNISFEEDIPDSSFNVVIHKHPDGVSSFSNTDWEDINKKFPISLLYESGQIVDASMRFVTHDNLVILIKPRVIVDYNVDVEIEDEELDSKIRINEPIFNQGVQRWFKSLK